MQRYRCGQGGPGSYTDPNFGYRYKNGSMTAGTLRVIFELGEVSQQDGGTQFILGSYAYWHPPFPPPVQAPDDVAVRKTDTKPTFQWRRLSSGGGRRRFLT